MEEEVGVVGNWQEGVEILYLLLPIVHEEMMDHFELLLDQEVLKQDLHHVDHHFQTVRGLNQQCPLPVILLDILKIWERYQMLHLNYQQC